MRDHAGNLSRGERITSALLGAGLMMVMARRGGPLMRILGGTLGASLLGRAFAGHCAMKAAVTGESTLKQGIADQWHRTSEMGRRVAQRVAESTQGQQSESSSESMPLGDEAAPRSVSGTERPTANAPF